MNEEIYEKVATLKGLLTAHATGGAVSESEYGQLRAELMAVPSLRSKLPSFVRSHRTLSEFWGFIQPKFKSYRERREFLMREFDPVLTHLESMAGAPSDEAVSSGLRMSSSEEVRAAWEKALARRSDDPEGAITSARTLLEATCKHVLEELNEPYDDKWDLPKLYGTAAAKLSLAPSQHTEQVFKQILGGCHSVVEGLGSLRNRLSDAHGKGKTAARPAARHAQLAVNLAGSLSMFLIETLRVRQSVEKH